MPLREDRWICSIDAVGRHVFEATYGCHPGSDSAQVLSHEHSAIALFPVTEVERLTIPDGYRRSIAAWFSDARREGPASGPGGQATPTGARRLRPVAGEERVDVLRLQWYVDRRREPPDVPASWLALCRRHLPQALHRS